MKQDYYIRQIVNLKVHVDFIHMYFALFVKCQQALVNKNFNIIAELSCLCSAILENQKDKWENQNFILILFHKGLIVT